MGARVWGSGRGESSRRERQLRCAQVSVPPLGGLCGQKSQSESCGVFSTLSQYYFRELLNAVKGGGTEKQEKPAVLILARCCKKFTHICKYVYKNIKGDDFQDASKGSLWVVIFSGKCYRFLIYTFLKTPGVSPTGMDCFYNQKQSWERIRNL